jgi:hypothetical protein
MRIRSDFYAIGLYVIVRIIRGMIALIRADVNVGIFDVSADSVDTVHTADKPLFLGFQIQSLRGCFHYHSILQPDDHHSWYPLCVTQEAWCNWAVCRSNLQIRCTDSPS